MADQTVTASVQESWCAKVITLFPEIFPGPLGCSLVGRALENNVWRLEVVDLKKFGLGNHRVVDDRPMGGGPGMVFRPDVVSAALESTAAGVSVCPSEWPVVLLTPRGKRLTQKQIQEWSCCRGITLVCGRFEGVDERIVQKFGLCEISIGDFVLSGGEIAAFVLIEGIVRLIPRVVGNQASVKEESYSANLLEYPHYTRPQHWNEMSVPAVLSSGDHSKIAAWRKAEAERVTRERRPDLWKAYCAETEKHLNDDRDK